jgi:hypothetical protein
MTEVAHPGAVPFGLVEISPFNRRAAGEPVISPFFLRRIHDRTSFGFGEAAVFFRVIFGLAAMAVEVSA